MKTYYCDDNEQFYYFYYGGYPYHYLVTDYLDSFVKIYYVPSIFLHSDYLDSFLKYIIEEKELVSGKFDILDILFRDYKCIHKSKIYDFFISNNLDYIEKLIDKETD